MLMENNRLPEMTSYVQVIRERQEKAETIPEEFYRTDAMMTQGWRGPSYKFRFAVHGFQNRIYINNSYREPNTSCRCLLQRRVYMITSKEENSHWNQYQQVSESLQKELYCFNQFMYIVLNFSKEMDKATEMLLK